MNIGGDSILHCKLLLLESDGSLKADSNPVCPESHCCCLLDRRLTCQIINEPFVVRICPSRKGVVCIYNIFEPIKQKSR